MYSGVCDSSFRRSDLGIAKRSSHEIEAYGCHRGAGSRGPRRRRVCVSLPGRLAAIYCALVRRDGGLVFADRSRARPASFALVTVIPEERPPLMGVSPLIPNSDRRHNRTSRVRPKVLAEHGSRALELPPNQPHNRRPPGPEASCNRAPANGSVSRLRSNPWASHGHFILVLSALKCVLGENPSEPLRIYARGRHSRSTRSNGLQIAMGSYKGKSALVRPPPCVGLLWRSNLFAGRNRWGLVPEVDTT